MPDQSPIFTVETQALFLVLECMEVSNHTKYVVYFDLLFCLQAVVGLKMNHTFVTKVLQNELVGNMDLISTCARCLAMLASEEISELIGLRRRL